MQQDVVCERCLNTIIVYYLECTSPLGMADRSKIKDSQITTSSVLRDAYGWQARLRQNIPNWGAWCLDVSGGSKTKKNYDQYIEIDLLKLTKITRIATQGREHAIGKEYVKDYKISYSKDSFNWIFYREKDQAANETKVDMINVCILHLQYLQRMTSNPNFICLDLELVEFSLTCEEQSHY